MRLGRRFDRLGQFAPHALIDGGVFLPVEPTPRQRGGGLAGLVALAKPVEEAQVLVVLDPVPQGLQPQAGHDAFVSDGPPRVDDAALAVVERAFAVVAAAVERFGVAPRVVDLPHGPFLFGKLRGYGGIPRGAKITAERLEETPNGRLFNVANYDVASSERDRKGYYGLSGLIPGTYLVRVTAERDGRSNLLVEMRIGAGDRTNFLQVGADATGASRILSAAGTVNLRPHIAIRGFSMEPCALSRFYDSGSDSPEYFEPVVSPSAVPRGVNMELLFQGENDVYQI